MTDESNVKTEHVSLREPCLWGSLGLPACQSGVRAERYWCHACTVKPIRELAEEWASGPAVGYDRNEQVELDTEKEHARTLLSLIRGGGDHG